MPDYGKKTVVELQEILKSRSLPHTGKKAELVARLNEADKSAETKTVDPAPSIATSATEPSNEKAAPMAEQPTSAKQVAQDSTAPETRTDQPASALTTQQTERESSTTTTDTKLANAANYNLGLNSSSYEDELKKRKARAERFGNPQTASEPLDAEAQKAAERAKRFGTVENGAGMGKLDEALPTEREHRRGGKRGRDGGGGDGNAMDDPGLKQGRGGKRRFRGHGRAGERGRNDTNRRGEKPTGVQKPRSAFSNEKDRLAAEARKKRFATA